MKIGNQSPLTPVPKVDKNGHTVTRWVKILDTGEPGINLPSPQSPALAQFAENVFEKLFPGTEADTGYLIDMAGDKHYYTSSFVKHALEKLPPKTLRKLADTLAGDSAPDRLQVHLCYSVNEYLAAMYENVAKDDVQDVYAKTVRDLSNSLVFYEVLDSLSVTMSHISAHDYPYILYTELSRYEKSNGTWVEQQPTEFGDPNPTLIDYSSLPQRKQREAMAYVITSRLMRESKDRRQVPSKELVKLCSENLDRQREFIEVVTTRGTDAAVLRDILNSEVPSMSSGIL